MITRYFSKLIHNHGSLQRRWMHNFLNVAEANSSEAVGKRKHVQGWIRSIRKMKDNIFIDINDGSSCEYLQVVLKKSDKPEELSYGSCVSITGEIFLINGKNEVHADDIRIIGSCDLNDGYPFLPRKKYSQDYVRQYLHLRARTRSFSSLLRLRHLASSAISDHMSNRGFINIHTPILTSNDCEGAGEVFTVKPESPLAVEEMQKDQPEDEAYFNGKTFLTVSGQLHLESMARALSRVYTFGPTFRAENSKSRLHLSEFYMIEAELAFITSLEELTHEVELFIKTITQILVEKGSNDMKVLQAEIPDWLNKNFGIITYDEAISILERHQHELKIPVKLGHALSKDHELFLVNHNGGTPLFIINWPKELKSFYIKEYSNDSTKVAAMDLLAPNVGEIVGGSLREDDYQKLTHKLPNTANLSWYLELRKYGNVPTGGFGMGFERYLQTVLNIPNIKDVIPFPRWPHNCSL